MKLHHVPIETITVVREARQRKNLAGLPELMDSIKENGLINPIVVSRDGVLIAGERRLTACKNLGYTHIPVIYRDEVDEDELQILELEENMKRVDLSWQEQCDAVRNLHRIFLERDPEWTIELTARRLAESPSSIGQKLAVATAIASGDKLVKEAPALSTAVNIVRRQQERRLEAAVIPQPNLKPKSRYHVPVLEGDFRTSNFNGARFNLFHCDFPYGINAEQHDQGAAASMGGYIDTPEYYFSLLDDFLTFVEGNAAPSAHLIFWFAMPHYQETLTRLRRLFWIDERPLIWLKSDNTGILSDPNRRFRYICEYAFFGSLGDRKLVRPKANAIAAPATKNIHMSEKPLPVVTHFLSALVDDTTFMVDPTAGSGSAVVAARQLGAGYAIGRDINPEFVKLANDFWRPTLEAL